MFAVVRIIFSARNLHEFPRASTFACKPLLRYMYLSHKVLVQSYNYMRGFTHVQAINKYAIDTIPIILSSNYVHIHMYIYRI